MAEMTRGAFGAATARPAPAWLVGLLAGVGAGIVAGAASVATLIAFRTHVPPYAATFWSALAAGILGGLLYAWLARMLPRPVPALWVVCLAIATIDSALIALLPLPSGRGPLGLPIVGLTTPLRQLLTFAGIGHLGTRHFPASSLPAATATHYITAVAVALLVPWWAPLRGGRGGLGG
jgi:hypothetical protein